MLLFQNIVSLLEEGPPQHVWEDLRAAAEMAFRCGTASITATLVRSHSLGMSFQWTIERMFGTIRTQVTRLGQQHVFAGIGNLLACQTVLAVPCSVASSACSFLLTRMTRWEPSLLSIPFS